MSHKLKEELYKQWHFQTLLLWTPLLTQSPSVPDSAIVISKLLRRSASQTHSYFPSHFVHFCCVIESVYTLHICSISKKIFLFLLTASVLEAQIGKPPDVAKTHGVGDARESEVILGAPGAASISLLGLQRGGVILDEIRLLGLLRLVLGDGVLVVLEAPGNFPDQRCERLHGENHIEADASPLLSSLNRRASNQPRVETPVVSAGTVGCYEG